MAAAKADPMADLGAVFGPGKSASATPPLAGLDEEAESEDGITPAFRTIAEEYLAAVKSGDDETAIRTLKAAIVECVETHTAGEY
jgi:hypothetical protein